MFDRMNSKARSSEVVRVSEDAIRGVGWLDQKDQKIRVTSRLTPR